MQNTFGAQLRHDDISSVGLYNTVARERISTTRQDDIGETSVGALRAERRSNGRRGFDRWSGLRGDEYHFHVTSDDPVKQRHARTKASSAPKAASSIGPFGGTELYANAGLGFHSNDARGTTITR